MIDLYIVPKKENGKVDCPVPSCFQEYSQLKSLKKHLRVHHQDEQQSLEPPIMETDIMESVRMETDIMEIDTVRDEIICGPLHIFKPLGTV